MSTINQRPSVAGTAASLAEMEIQLPGEAITKKLTLVQLKAALDAIGGDVVIPTVLTAIVNNASPNQVVVTFSESVTVTTAGWSFRRAGVNWPVSSLAGSGTTWTFTMATAAVNGETLDRSYDQGAGNTIDGAGNELASFTNSSVTNNVGGGGGYQAETLTFETGLGAVGSGWSLTEKDTTDALVVAAKNIGLSKFQAIHIYVGNNLAGAYLNLVNPNNSNAAFRLSVAGGAPTLSNGLQLNNTRVNTHFNYSTNFADVNNLHMFYMYSGATSESACGVKGGTFGDAGLILGGYYAGANFLASNGGKQYFEAGIGTAAGDVLLTRRAAGNANCNAYFNGVERTVFSAAGGDVPNANIYYGSVNRQADPNAPDNIGDIKLLVCSIGTGLTTQEALDWRAACLAFKTALGR